MPNRPPRLELIFQKYDPPLYFVTFNTWRRRKLLASDSVQSAFIEFATRDVGRNVSIGRYVMMPDHVRLFARGSSDKLLTQWMRLLKRKLSTAIRHPRPHWQAGFFDHIIRSSESYSEKWNYVFKNPVRAGLVETPDEWPWQGEIVRIEE